MKNYTLFIMFNLLFVTVFGQVRLIPVVTGLSSPTSMKADPMNRFYITGREGRIIMADTAGNTHVFLDITDRVKAAGQEQGLLGIALHPAFFENGYFYVNYTGDGDSTHISRFTRNPADTGVALPGSELNLMTVYQPFQNHNGGDLHFGPDLNLYIALGDGGGAGDPGNRAQNKGELLGKILRINVLAGDPYAIPPDNPFVSDPLARPEIWSLGLRNPWRFSFDRSTGDMWLADVGQGDREEINLEPEGATGGLNYGWRCYEGSLPYNTSGCQPQNAYVFPVYEYAHDQSPCWSVTGGYRYRGTLSSGMSGKYFFSDYCKDTIWSLKDNGGTWEATTEAAYPGNNFSCFAEDANGELYILGLSSGIAYRLADSSASGTVDRDQAYVRMYPNPVHDDLTLEGRTPETIRMVLGDLSGKVLLTGEFSGKTTISLGDFAPGVYLLKLESKNFSFTRKIIRK